MTFLRPADEIDALLARRGYRLHPDRDDEMLWHILWCPDRGDEGARVVCVGVVTQLDRALETLEACGWPEAPIWGWCCPVHAPQEPDAA